MEADIISDLLGPDDVAEVLDNVATLIEHLHHSDEALQTALSSLAGAQDSASTPFELQHLDLLTQSHLDLFKLTRILACWARGTPVRRGDLRDVLTMRGLKDRLVDSHAEEKTTEPGELQLF